MIFFDKYLHIPNICSNFATEMKAYSNHNNFKTITTMAQTAMTVRLDNRLKSQFDSLCEQFGMSANAAINVFINAVVRTRSIPFTISAEEDSVRKRALEAFLHADRSDRPEMTLEEINAEISAARRERKERLERERQQSQRA